jgi:2-hydroxychromene-2-carboxylate isomerase
MSPTPSPIEFWFDLSSPYAYFGALKIDAVAARHGRRVAWRPFLLGVVYQLTGMKPLPDQPLRGAYARRDWERLGRLHGEPFVLPANFPMRTQAAARMIYAVEAQSPGHAPTFSKALLQAAFGKGVEIARLEVAADIGSSVGLDPAKLAAAAEAAEWKNALRQRCDEALAKGVFGSPFMIVDGEPFWGADRLPMLDLWLEQGSWESADRR